MTCNKFILPCVSLELTATHPACLLFACSAHRSHPQSLLSLQSTAQKLGMGSPHMCGDAWWSEMGQRGTLLCSFRKYTMDEMSLRKSKEHCWNGELNARKKHFWDRQGTEGQGYKPKSSSDKQQRDPARVGITCDRGGLEAAGFWEQLA